MNTVCKILLVSLLSFNLPTGKLTEIFSWVNRISRIESVFKLKRSGINARTCIFRKLVEKYFREFRNYNREQSIKQVRTLEESLILKTQIQIAASLKIRLIRHFAFMVLYSDEPYIEFIRS